MSFMTPFYHRLLFLISIELRIDTLVDTLLVNRVVCQRQVWRCHFQYHLAPPPSHDCLPQGNRDVPPPEGTSHGCNGCYGCYGCYGWLRLRSSVSFRPMNRVPQLSSDILTSILDRTTRLTTYVHTRLSSFSELYWVTVGTSSAWPTIQQWTTD